MKSNIVKPRIVAFEVTHRCASHCRAAASAGGGSGELSSEQCRRILAGLAHYRKAVVVLTGPDPLCIPTQQGA